MKYLMLLLGAIFLNLTIAGAQEEANKSISVGYGLSMVQRQDLIFSPFVHSDLSPISTFLQYEREKKIVHRVQFQLGVYRAQQTEPYTYQIDGELAETYPHNFTYIDLNYQIGLQKSLGNKIELTYGLGSLNNIQFTDYGFGYLSHSGYAIALSLGAWADLEYALSDKDKLGLNLNLPIISWQARSPYLANDDEFILNISSNNAIKTLGAYIADGQWMGGKSVYRINTGIGYERLLSEKWALGARYDVEINRQEYPRPLNSIRHNFFIVATLTF